MHLSPRTLAVCALALALGGCASAPAPADADLYVNFTLLDPIRERRTEDAWVLVADGRIADVGRGPPPRLAAARVHDMDGAFALPGLIDAHAHVTLGRVSIAMVDGAPVIGASSEAEITTHNARMLVAHGVTTIRNPGGATQANAAYDEAVRAGALVGPEQHAAGEILDTSRIDGLTLVVSDAASIEAAVERQAAAGMDYIKLYQGLSETQFAAGVEAAHRHGLRALTHTGAITWTRAAELGVDGIVHAMPISADSLPPAARAGYQGPDVAGAHAFYTWWERADLDSPQMRDLVAALAEHDVTVDLTMVVFQKAFWGDDAAVRERGSEFAHPLMRENWRTFRFDIGWGPEHYARARAVWPKIQRFARMLHDAGVPLAIGTDLANPFVSPGRDVLAEMRLHGEAGIPNWAVLRMATSDAAHSMGLSGRIGRIGEGMEADILFLDGDPSADLAKLDDARAVLLNGVLYDAMALRSGQ